MSAHTQAGEWPTASLAAALAAWATRRSGSALVGRALALAASAEAEGHACARLKPTGLDLEALAAHPWIGDGSARRPAVLDRAGRLFLWRNWVHEQRIAAAIRQRLQAGDPAADAAAEADLALLFAAIDPTQGAGQLAAARGILGRRIFLLSGGPGTGKTTTVLRMLLLHQRAALRAGARRPMSMALAAPTGKAAQRLGQALRDEGERLRNSLGSQLEDWLPALQALPDSAQTLHRLLGFLPGEDRFRHHAGQPLAYDLVLVDEASMVDLGLMRALVDALPAQATLVLVGDPDQLVSVSAGSVFADLVALAEEGSLGAAHIRLQHVWRAEGRLAEVYDRVRAGSPDGLRACIGEAWQTRLIETTERSALSRRLEDWLERPEWQALDALAQAADPDPGALFAQLRRLQLLCALREGEFGSQGANAWIDSQRRARLGGGLWYPGRAVLLRHNDHARRLYNGDVGIALRRHGQIRVVFESTDRDGRPLYRELGTRELPEHDLAWALTVHKSQGSEYGHVAVLLPPDPASPILSRQLLYTAVSRAKLSLEIWTSEASLEQCLQHRLAREGGLRERLADGLDLPAAYRA